MIAIDFNKLFSNCLSGWPNFLIITEKLPRLSPFYFHEIFVTSFRKLVEHDIAILFSFFIKVPFVFRLTKKYVNVNAVNIVNTQCGNFGKLLQSFFGKIP